MSEYAPSFLRDCIVLGLSFAGAIYGGARIGYQLAKARFTREGHAQGAALQRRHITGPCIVIARPTANRRN